MARSYIVTKVQQDVFLTAMQVGLSVNMCISGWKFCCVFLSSYLSFLGIITVVLVADSWYAVSLYLQ
jgi:hypothetical protein